MKNRKRTIVILLALIIALTAFMSAEIASGKFHHECIGEHCAICVICAKCSDWTKSFGLPETALMAKILFCCVLLFVKARSEAFANFSTPVVLKDKMTD